MTPIVTDHCLVRYLERVMGLDVEAVRVKIGKLCADKGNALSVKVDGHTFILRGTSVVTVRPNQVNNPRRVPR